MSKQKNPGKEKGSIITVTFRSVRGGKPPLEFYYFDLYIKNNRPHPVWYISRYWGEQPLQDVFYIKNEVFGKNNIVDHSVDGSKTGGKGVVHVQRVMCDQDHSFAAFLLPAGCMLTYEGFEMETWEDVAVFEIWEALSLKMNGNIPYEEWVPFKAMSSKEIVIPAGTDWFHHSGFEWKPGKDSSSYPSGVVTHIIPEVLAKHVLPF